MIETASEHLISSFTRVQCDVGNYQSASFVTRSIARLLKNNEFAFYLNAESTRLNWH